MSGISGVSGSSMMFSGINSGSRMQPPDPSKMADDLFSKLDTKGQGYLEKSDLQTAFNAISSSNGQSANTPNVDDVFKQLDSNGDGKITKQEMTDVFEKMDAQIHSQMTQMKMRGAGGQSGMGNMPPPPPPSSDGSDAGLTKDQMTAMLNDTSSADSSGKDSLSKLVNNFDAADTNKDGKISMQEAMNYNKTDNNNSTVSTASTSTSDKSSSSISNSLSEQVARQIMLLVQAYSTQETQASSSLLNTTA